MEDKLGFSILITDDDRSFRESLREIVEAEGYRTLLASCGEEAIEIVRQEPVHLAVLDFNMPTLNGLETLQIVRQTNATLPAILVTASATGEVMRQAFFAHVYSVLPKPVNRNMVVYTVVRALTLTYGEQPEATD
jgi:CheY-like chemotaxis protein